jgi:hypothetical protein
MRALDEGESFVITRDGTPVGELRVRSRDSRACLTSWREGSWTPRSLLILIDLTLVSFQREWRYLRSPWLSASNP